MNFPNIVTREEWLKARKALLAREKEFTRQRYALADALRKLPMVKIEKDYPFDAPKGTVTLCDGLPSASRRTRRCPGPDHYTRFD